MPFQKINSANPRKGGDTAAPKRNCARKGWNTSHLDFSSINFRGLWSGYFLQERRYPQGLGVDSPLLFQRIWAFDCWQWPSEPALNWKIGYPWAMDWSYSSRRDSRPKIGSHNHAHRVVVQIPNLKTQNRTRGLQQIDHISRGVYWGSSEPRVFCSVSNLFSGFEIGRCPLAPHVNIFQSPVMLLQELVVSLLLWRY